MAGFLLTTLRKSLQPKFARQSSISITRCLLVGGSLIVIFTVSQLLYDTPKSAADDSYCPGYDTCGTMEPFFVVQGGDVANSSPFVADDGSCPNVTTDPNLPGSDVGSWNNNNAGNNGYYGAGVQDAVYTADVAYQLVSGLDTNADLSSGAYSYSTPGTSPVALSFANKDQYDWWDSGGTSWPVTLAAGYDGGDYSFGPCIPDYYQSAVSSGTTPLTSTNAMINSDTVDLSSLPGGSYSFTGTLIIDDSGPITDASTDGIPITLAINGNAYVESSITYSYDNPSDIPQLNLYAYGVTGSGVSAATSATYGNIYIQNDVAEIHGFFVAEGNDQDQISLDNYFGTDFTHSDFTSGLFADCATIAEPDETITTNGNYTPCYSQLKIVGSVDANVFFLERSYGNLNDMDLGPTDADNAAEIFEYSPELWIPDATASECVNTPSQCVENNYASETSLPPVF